MFKGGEHSKYMNVQSHLVLGMEGDLIQYFQNLEDKIHLFQGLITTFAHTLDLFLSTEFEHVNNLEF